MRERLKAELDKKMEEWVAENCELDDWPQVYVHESMAEDMADTAADVFETVEINQLWLKQQGHLK